MYDTFEKVWYRAQPLGGAELTMKAMTDRGSLTIGQGRLEFRGAKKHVDVTDIKGVSMQRAGRDFVNRWVTVTYGDGQTAMFVDGRLLGWSGIFGGNKRLLKVIEQAISS
jgi:hypothetical protein